MENHQSLINHAVLAYRGKRFDVRTCQLPTKSGHMHTFEAMIHPGAVVILPLLDENQLILIKNYRLTVGESLWELPAGTIETDEPHQQTALRELAEETGYKASEISLLTTFFSSPGVSNEILYAYLAKGLHLTEQNLDENEKITTHTLSWQQVLTMIKSGEIKDSKTLTTLLYYYSLRL